MASRTRSGDTTTIIRDEEHGEMSESEMAAIAYSDDPLERDAFIDGVSWLLNRARESQQLLFEKTDTEQAEPIMRLVDVEKLEELCK